MPERRAALSQLEVAQHPAAVAWRQLGVGPAHPRAVVRVEKGPGRSRKSAVFRLEGAGDNGTAVMAKRCNRRDADIERTIYEQILPHLPLSTPWFFGMAAGDDETSSWLFMEDVGDEAYSPRHFAHRTIAGQWLGTLHASAMSLPPNIPLPDRGSAHYLEHLRSARDTIEANLENSALDRAQRHRLRGIISSCDLVESKWSHIEQFCLSMPTTLVHGDFIGKNVRMRSRAGDIEILPFDWEVAGRGVPAVDLAQSALPSTGFLSNPDLDAYRVAAGWRDLTCESIQRLGVYGVIFRCLAALHWESRSLVYPSVEWPVKNMAQYEAELMEAARAAGWRT